MMCSKRIALAIVLLTTCVVLALPDTAHARRKWRGGGGGSSYSGVPAGHTTATAQGVANIMAATGRVGHWGGNPGYEGCGSGGSPAAAYAICCYANSGMHTYDVGYAQGAGGMWFCCRRYGNFARPAPAAAPAAPVASEVKPAAEKPAVEASTTSG